MPAPARTRGRNPNRQTRAYAQVAHSQRTKPGDWFIMPRMQLEGQLVPQKTRRTHAETQREPPYRVIVHNDDVTPMDFVTHILVTVFFIPNETALPIMYAAHLNGAAYVA